jgi:AcrR family transcriptional regulator
VTTAPTSEARTRILETARRLFESDGYAAVGVDRIVAEADIAKMTLYRHFPSKDDLIIAHLEASNEHYLTWLDDAVTDIDDPADKLLGMLTAIGDFATSPACPGCTFQVAAAEFPDPTHPVHAVASANKAAVRERFRGLASEAGLTNSDSVADQLMLVMDGALAAARMLGPDSHAKGTTAAARAIIENARP